MNEAVPKYASLEIERRWLVDERFAVPPVGCPYRTIEDHYILGTRLRLRKISSPGAEPVFKLCKKYGKVNHFAESITNLYLSSLEYTVFVVLPAVSLIKQRYAFADGSLDMFLSSHLGLVIFEREFASVEAAEAYNPPDFVVTEITGNTSYAGAVLAGMPL